MRAMLHSWVQNGRFMCSSGGYVLRALTGLTAVLAFSGCATPQHFKADIHSENAGDRILAIRQAAEKGDRSAMPLIVDRLDDEDDGVRLYAILALEKLVGTRMGYEYSAPFERRVASVERWREYVRSGRHMAGSPPVAATSAEAGNLMERKGESR